MNKIQNNKIKLKFNLRQGLTNKMLEKLETTLSVSIYASHNQTNGYELGIIH